MSEEAVYSAQVTDLLDGHLHHLHVGSGISVGTMEARGYRSAIDKRELEELGWFVRITVESAEICGKRQATPSARRAGVRCSNH